MHRADKLSIEENISGMVMVNIQYERDAVVVLVTVVEDEKKSSLHG